MIKGLPGRAWADLRFQARLSFTFQLFVQLATFAVTGPLLAWAIRRLVLLTAEPVVTNFDIPAFVLSPGGVAVVVSSVMLSGAALLAELAGQSWIAGHAIARRQVSLGSTMIVDGVVEAMELAHMRYTKNKTFEEVVGDRGRRRLGAKKWARAVADVVGILGTALEADYVVLGGGNARKLKSMPKGAQLGDNNFAFVGGFRMWRKGGLLRRR